MKIRWLLIALILPLSWGSVAQAIPITMQWTGRAIGTSAVIDFIYEDSALDTNVADPLRGEFDGAFTMFDITFGDGLRFTLDKDAPNSLSIFRRHQGLMGVSFFGNLVNANGERFVMTGISEIEYPTLGPYDTLTQVANYGWIGFETYFFIEGGELGPDGTYSFGRGMVPGNGEYRFRIVDVPEPSSLLLLSLGLLGLTRRRRSE